MRAKQAGLLLGLLWLAGCATPQPVPQTKAQGEPQVQEQERNQEQIEEEEEARIEALQEQERKLTAARMLSDLEQVAALEPNAATKMLEHLRSESGELSAGDRFKLLLLLSRKGADDKSLKRAWEILNSLEAEAKDPGAREILQLQRSNLDLEQRYRAERRKTVELRKKIEHLKGLERELDESNKRMEEPLTPNPEPAQ
jgi:hypothetical protein